MLSAAIPLIPDFHFGVQNTPVIHPRTSAAGGLFRRTFFQARDSLYAAVGAFEGALKLDPNYAPARAGLGTASALIGNRYASNSEIRTWRERAEREVRAAI